MDDYAVVAGNNLAFFAVFVRFTSPVSVLFGERVPFSTQNRIEVPLSGKMYPRYLKIMF